MDEAIGGRAAAGERAPGGSGDARNELTHLRPEGGVRMVDIGGKSVTFRKAVARGEIRMSPETLALISQGKVAKGDVLTAAQIAGIMAAKRTQELIPLCHQINLTGVDVELRVNPERSVVEVEATARLEGKTGAEMEALVAVAISCLTVYDMCKAVDKEMEIGRIRLVEKSGGKSGSFVREDERPCQHE
ncbi:MAG: cyclic pyranopterin monophosphate synthase MoaC [Firmicutes bacterium]|nr:cyclic pyranopterin monophosphate synthase MoaC [Candidatus Fermentithermobacillaceae bacterium]